MQSQPAAQRQSCLRPGCFFTLLFLAAFVYLALRGLGAYLIAGDPLERSDAVVVLGGGGEHRVVEAARLIKQEYGLWLIITEPDPSEGEERAGSAAYREVAILQGISPDIILITEKTALSTYQEAVAVLHAMELHGLNSVIVVTDPFHTHRTEMIFDEVFRDSGRTVRIHPVEGHWYRSGTWFLRGEGWGHTFREYAKLLGFWLGLTKTVE